MAARVGPTVEFTQEGAQELLQDGRDDCSEGHEYVLTWYFRYFKRW